jgi:hypothetical protein
MLLYYTINTKTKCVQLQIINTTNANDVNFNLTCNNMLLHKILLIGVYTYIIVTNVIYEWKNETINK